MIIGKESAVEMIKTQENVEAYFIYLDENGKVQDCWVR